MTNSKPLQSSALNKAFTAEWLELCAVRCGPVCLKAKHLWSDFLLGGLIFFLFYQQTEECQLCFTTNDYPHQLRFRGAFMQCSYMFEQLDCLNTWNSSVTESVERFSAQEQVKLFTEYKQQWV